jgi:Trk-type K+ transport system membrane component
MFPANQTWAVFLTSLVLLTMWQATICFSYSITRTHYVEHMQFVMSMAVDYNLPVYSPYSGPIRGLISYFQAVSTRTAGFNVIGECLEAF